MAQASQTPEAQLEMPASSEIESLELFRRSPHPYHRRQHDLRATEASSESSSYNPSRTSLHPSYNPPSDEDDRKRRKTSQSPSESGTEADDEGYSFVKALPAPPLRPRKGLRNARGTELDSDATPLLTPSQVDEEGRKLSGQYFQRRKDGSRSGGASPTDDEAKAARQKYLKRRRNEVVRRTTETALLGVIGILAVSGCDSWEKLLQWHRELLTHAVVMAGVLSLYPLRLQYYSWRKQPRSNLRFRQRIRIPAAFDPAPILYPAIVPVLISISLFSALPKALLPNVLLGLAALPPQLIPYGSSSAGYSSVHWFISILPLIASENTEFSSKIFAPIPYKLKIPSPRQGLHPELLVCLFPLHQALLPPLYYLTTTSLLPAELHLLSIGMINLLLFTESPQAGILRTLLWLGGVSLFVFCGRVLKWGVALARIPKLRFRRAGQVIKTQQSFLKVIQDSLRSRSATRAVSDSDADEDDPLFSSPLTKTKSLKLDVLNALRSKSTVSNGNEPHSAVERKHVREPTTLASLPKRRNTVPSLPIQNPISWNGLRQRKRTKSIAQHFLNLTPTQALYRKWLYAAYFYFLVALLILGPIRYVISKSSLHNHEPFGWAIGYLFGNIQPLRFQIFTWNLTTWIPLPPLFDPSLLPLTPLPPAEHLRNLTLHPANTRLLLSTYCLATLSLGLTVVLRLSSTIEVDTRRKVFHGTMVAILLPTIYLDPCFVHLALSLVLAIFLLLDLIRASQLPPLSAPIASFLTPYVDGRDLRGPVIVSHIFLLIGCAIPVWLSLAGVDRVGDEPWVGWDVAHRDVSMVAGVVCVGMGDAAASLIGRRFGRRKWPWAGGKSLEGSLAFAGAVMVGLVGGKVWLLVGWGGEEVWGRGGWEGMVEKGVWEGIWEWIWERGVWKLMVEAGVVVGKAGVCAVGASLEEAVLTGGNDNVIVPVVLWVLVRGVGL